MAEIDEVVERYRVEWELPALKLHYTVSRGHHLQVQTALVELCGGVRAPREAECGAWASPAHCPPPVPTVVFTAAARIRCVDGPPAVPRPGMCVCVCLCVSVCGLVVLAVKLLE